LKKGRQIMTIPVSGHPVRGSKSGAPIMALLDLLGRRWAMGVVWTLAETGPCTFRDLQERCGDVPPGTLNTRLRELRAAGLVDHDEGGYRVTGRGQELYGLLVPLGAWSKEWASDLA
jgi:DNA-binding HxlR family transcriptional regulator